MFRVPPLGGVLSDTSAGMQIVNRTMSEYNRIREPDKTARSSGDSKTFRLKEKIEQYK